MNIWLILLIGAIIGWLPASWVGWRLSRFGNMPFNWRVFVWPTVYLKWLDRSDS